MFLQLTPIAAKKNPPPTQHGLLFGDRAIHREDFYSRETQSNTPPTREDDERIVNEGEWGYGKKYGYKDSVNPVCPVYRREIAKRVQICLRALQD